MWNQQNGEWMWNQQNGEWNLNENWDFNDSRSEIEQEVEKRLNEMSEEELNDLTERIKEEIDKKNIEEHWKDLDVQKWLLEKEKEKSIKDRLKDLFASKETKQKQREENEKRKSSEESQRKMQNVWDQIVDAVETREKDLEEKGHIEESLDEIVEELSEEKDLSKMKELQDKLDEKEELIENIETKDIKEILKDKIEKMKSYLEQQQNRYENDLKKSWFSVEEEENYREYLWIEKEMEKHLDRFIKKLEDEIPKLKEFGYEWWYSSWRITDMNDAGRKLRLKQWGQKLYSRMEEKESLEVNLWICLSIDNSWSMSTNMEDTKRLAVFLWLLCQKWWIPFHVNTFWDDLNIIKDTDDNFEWQKWKLMRELNANWWWTNMGIAVQEDLDVIKKVKKTHPDTVFLPIFITDWRANSWITGVDLIELIKWFKWLSIMVGIWIDEQSLKNGYPDSKVIWLDSSSEIMTKLLRALKQFLRHNKSKIFKVTSE